MWASPVLNRNFSIEKNSRLLNVDKDLEKAVEAPSSFESFRKIPAAVGEGYMREIRLKKGMSMYVEDITPRSDFSVSVDTAHYPVRFLFTVQGALETRNKRTGVERILRAGTGDLTFTPLPLTGTLRKKAGVRTSRVAVLIEPEVFIGLVSDASDELPTALRRLLEDGRGPLFYRTVKQSPAVSSALYQILTCPYENLGRRLFLESKALELIALQLNYLGEADPGGIPSVDRDYKKIYEARDILVSSMEEPPGLFELAKTVGLSHTKLNRGFHELFDTTVFGYLRTARLETARRYLLDGEMNVTEAAFAVGYSSLSHFSLAFKEYTGFYPGDLKKSS